MSELRIGVVGLGWVAGAHIDAFKSVKGARVTFQGARKTTDARGRVKITKLFRGAGTRTAGASYRGVKSAKTTVRVRR